MNIIERQKRSGVSLLFAPFFHAEIHPVGLNGLSRARSLMDEGYGLIVGYTHFSERDPIDVIRFVMGWPTFRDKAIVCPMAYHMHQKYGSFLGPLARNASIDLRPIVIKDTLEKKGFEHMTLGDGVPEYLQAGIDALANGDIVVVSPQGGRRAYLGEPEPVLSTLMVEAKRHHMEKYAVLFVGVELKGIERFGEMSGLNMSNVMRMNIGNTFTAEEVFQISGRFRGIDRFAFGQLATLEPSSYLHPKIAPVGSSV